MQPWALSLNVPFCLQEERDKRRAEREKDDEEALVGGGLGKKKGQAFRSSCVLSLDKATTVFFSLQSPELTSFGTTKPVKGPHLQTLRFAGVLDFCPTRSCPWHLRTEALASQRLQRRQLQQLVRRLHGSIGTVLFWSFVSRVGQDFGVMLRCLIAFAILKHFETLIIFHVFFDASFMKFIFIDLVRQSSDIAGANLLLHFFVSSALPTC